MTVRCPACERTDALEFHPFRYPRYCLLPQIRDGAPPVPDGIAYMQKGVCRRCKIAIALDVAADGQQTVRLPRPASDPHRENPGDPRDINGKSAGSRKT